MFGFFFLFSLYLQFARGYSPLDAGLATLPLPWTFMIVSPRSAAWPSASAAGGRSPTASSSSAPAWVVMA